MNTRKEFYFFKMGKKKEKDPNKKGFFGEFKEFITRGNVLDLAVGIIIGGAFTAIVTALTAGILQPIINWILGLIFPGNGLTAARTVLGGYIMTDGTILYSAKAVKEAALNGLAVDWAATNYIDWGAFISAVINFLLVALVLFCIIKAINKVRSVSESEKAKLVELKNKKGAGKSKEEEKIEESPEE